jgi:eukaryotic-like serine/threonine-protein kinase
VDQGLVGGRYRLDERLGVGGMAEVWAAEDVELGRRVALKLLAADADPARFEREAHAVAALAHPNICQVYDYGDADGRPFMVLEYLGGGTLEDRLVPGEPYPDDETARIASELASGLAHAHTRGLVHRDLKPANVLFDDEGRPKIADFGIARLSGAGTLTEAGTMLGTAAYISPEQAQGLAATAASDVYSFGVILYRLLSGRLPFESESALELAAMHVNERPRPVRELRGDAPAALAAVAEEALKKDPAARLPDGAALVEALAGSAPTIVSAPAVAAGAAPTLVLPRQDRRRAAARWRNVVPIAIVAVLLLALGGAGIAVLASRGSGSSNEPTPPPPAARQVKAPTTQTQPTAPAPAVSTASPTTRPSTSTRATTTVPTAAPPPPPPPPPTTTTPPPPPTTVPTTTTLPVTTTTPPPPPPTP